MALIAVVSIGAVTALGSSTSGTLDSVDFGGSQAPQQINFSFCATEGGTCTMAGTHTVRYGANGTFVEQVRTGDFPCTNAVFGDPVPGVTKQCLVGDD